MLNKNLQRLTEPGVRLHLIFLVAFAVITVLCGQYELAAIEGVAILFLVFYTMFSKRRKEKQLAAYIESITYDADNAKNSTLMNFPLPICVFGLETSKIVWGNEIFFQMCGSSGTRLDARISDLVPQFNSKWLLEGKNRYPELLEINGKKYQLQGNVIRSERDDSNSEPLMGITYWVDITEYEDIRTKFENTRPIAGVIVIDNLDELTKNQPERIKNDIRDAVEDKLTQWCDGYGGILRRYDRDRYIVVFEKQDIEHMKLDKFRITEQMHQVESPTGIDASISIGLGADANTLGEALQFADSAIELAISRGGDQAVIKDRLSFEFFGGKGMEVEKRTKVKSRVMANTFAELIRDSDRVLVMGHKFADLDSVGAAVGVCCLVKKCGIRVNIVIDANKNASHQLIDKIKQDSEYKDIFISPQDAKYRITGRTLLVIVDTNKPEQVEDPSFLALCNRVAVIDHHRIGATYIQNAALGFVEPYASSTCELMTEILQELLDQPDVRKCEADALLAGIVLDTKNFTIRTGDRTFDAAAYLRRSGADTTDVKKLLQTDMGDTVARYKIMQSAQQYRGIAIAAPDKPQDRIVAAQAADELLNISGVDASIVAYPNGNGGVSASARSIGDFNVQLIMEKLGGGGNRSSAAVQMENISLTEAINKIHSAIDDYLG